MILGNRIARGRIDNIKAPIMKDIENLGMGDVSVREFYGAMDAARDITRAVWDIMPHLWWGMTGTKEYDDETSGS